MDRFLSVSGSKRLASLVLPFLFLGLHILPLSAAKKPKQAADSITVQADAVPIKNFDATDFALQDEETWNDIYEALHISELSKGKTFDLDKLSCLSSDVDNSQAYVIHLAKWSSDKTPQLVSSSWSAYAAVNNSKYDLKRRLTSAGDPLIFNKGHVLFIGINVFPAKNANNLTISYKTSVTQGTPENVQALGQLVTTLIGIPTNAKAAEADNLVAFICQAGTEHLPFDFSVVENVGVPTPPQSDKSDSSKSSQTPPPASSHSLALPSASPADRVTVPPTATSSNSSIPHERTSGGPSTTGSDHSLTEGSLEQPTRNNFTEPPVTELSSLSQPNRQSPQGGQAPQGSDASQDNQSQSDQSAQGNRTSKKSSPPSSNSSPTSGQADCTSLAAKNSCTISRTLTSIDPEWWDVSLGVSIPGVKETSYSIANSTLVAKPTTHTDIYAFFDIDPAGYFFTKDTYVPHFAVGLPVAGQTLYRPFFGIAGNLTGWAQRLGFPVRMNYFVGAVYMKTTVVTGSPTTNAELTTDSSKKRVTKLLFGVEVPVSALISKVGKGNKTTSTNSKTGNSSATNAGSSAGNTSQ